MNKSIKIIREGLLILLALLFLSPVYIMIVNSFKNRQELYENVIALPKQFSFQYYLEAMDKMNFLTAFSNSLFISIISVVFIVTLSSMTAWMLARTDNRLSKIIFMTFIATMLIPFQTIMMPLIQLMNTIMSDLNIPMLNTRGGLIF